MTEDTCELNVIKVGDNYCNMDFTPNELEWMKAAHLKNNRKECPFCHSEVHFIKRQCHNGDKNKIFTAHECSDCHGMWKYEYDFTDLSFLNIPTRATLCYQRETLINQAIDRLKQHGDKYFANRLEKLFKGALYAAI